MTGRQSDLSRRKLLSVAGTIGGAAALGGTSTLAFFADEEEFANNRLVAGELDLGLAWEELYFGAHAASEMASGGFSAKEFLSAEATTLERYPDPDSGAAASFATVRSEPCQQGSLYADTPEDLDPRTGFRTNNADTLAGDGPRPLLVVQDATPGDFGIVRLRLALCDSPGYVWSTGGIRSLSENGTTEPERKDEDSTGGAGGQVADEIRVRLFQDRTGTAVTEFFGGLDESMDGPDLIEAAFDLFALDQTAPTLSEFAELLSTGQGFPLDGDPFSGASPAGTTEMAGDLFLYGLPEGGGQAATARECFDTTSTAADLGLVWGLPVDHANEIQTDSVSFDLGVYAEQCRHNDGNGSGGGATGNDGGNVDSSGEEDDES
jgi:predicted ribosomally synthesized peptide with SipW-like signal peptide